MKSWQLVVANNEIRPSKNEIVIYASVETEVLPANEVVDGKKLQQTWRDIVHATHPVTGQAYRKPADEVFDPINLDDFLAIRCRAVSGMETWGSNINGDAFPAKELVQAYMTFVGKGFYIEHRSYHPINAVGIIAHAEWVPSDEFVTTVPLVDKKTFPKEAEEIKRLLGGKTAGVSMGCIASSAECSICGNVARNKNEICSHMERGHYQCVKGKKLLNGIMAHDVCRGLTFYELSFTRVPADRDARPHYIFGSDFKAAKGDVENNGAAENGKPKETEEEKPKETAPAVPAISEIKIPDEAKLEQMVDKIVDRVLVGRINKLIRLKIEQELAPFLKQVQVDLKPQIEERVKEKKEAVEQAVAS